MFLSKRKCVANSNSNSLKLLYSQHYKKVVMILCFIDPFHDDTLCYFILAQTLSPLFSRSPSGDSGAGGEGRNLRLARGIGPSRGAVWWAAPPSQSLFPECRAHPGAEGERERPGEGRRLLICSLKAANILRRFKNVKHTVPDR